MRSKGIMLALGFLGATTVFAQAPAAGQRQGAGIQAPQDPRYQSVIAACKNPPPPTPQRGAPPPSSPDAREYTVTAIPGVIAAGQKWTTVWKGSGNVADGIIGTSDGGVMIAQNDKSDVLKIDKDGKESVAYTDTNTGGALSMNSKGALFIVERALNPAIVQLAPQRKVLADKYLNGDPMDCIGGVINDLSADSKGGAYFTMGVFGMAGVFYASPKGVVTKYGEGLNTNGVILSPDEKTLYVTNGTALAAFDVQPDGSLKNQREFAKFLQDGRGDGATVDAMGRIYVTTGPGIQVIGVDGKVLGLIPTPRSIISTAFSGPDKKTLFAVVSYGPRTSLNAEVISIPMIAQGYKGRAK